MMTKSNQETGLNVKTSRITEIPVTLVKSYITDYNRGFTGRQLKRKYKIKCLSTIYWLNRRLRVAGFLPPKTRMATKPRVVLDIKPVLQSPEGFNTIHFPNGMKLMIDRDFTNKVMIDNKGNIKILNQ